MNFRVAVQLIEKQADQMAGAEWGMDAGWPTDRPTVHQPPVESDGLDPAALGGPAPMNGFGPLGAPVVSDPLLPINPDSKGQSIPHIPGPDLDTVTLKNYRQKGGPIQGQDQTT